MKIINDVLDEVFNEDISAIGTIHIPQGINHFAKDVFRNCTLLHEIDIPDNIISIPIAAFRGCERLHKVSIGKNVSEIKNFAFDGCTSLNKIIIPDSVKTIDHGAFLECVNLHKVVIYDSISSIAPGAFINCPRLEKIIIVGDRLEEFLRVKNLLHESVQHLAVPFEAYKVAHQTAELISNIPGSSLRFSNLSQVCKNKVDISKGIPLEIIDKISGFSYGNRASAAALICLKKLDGFNFSYPNLALACQHHRSNKIIQQENLAISKIRPS